jgi:hypothetical protein
MLEKGQCARQWLRCPYRSAVGQQALRAVVAACHFPCGPPRHEMASTAPAPSSSRNMGLLPLSHPAGIPKLDDANDAGTRNSGNCTLILTEGDSAKTLAIAGLSVVGRDRYGVFPLRCIGGSGPSAGLRCLGVLCSADRMQKGFVLHGWLSGATQINCHELHARPSKLHLRWWQMHAPMSDNAASC